MKKSILKRFITEEELEHFNKLREIDNRAAAQYMASLDLFEPTNLDIIDNNVKQKTDNNRINE